LVTDVTAGRGIGLFQSITQNHERTQAHCASVCIFRSNTRIHD